MKFNPLYHPLVLARPARHSIMFDSTPFLPFFAYLVSALKPKTYYEIGVLGGESFSYMCQLSAASDVRFKCVGIDLFEASETDLNCQQTYARFSNDYGITDVYPYLSYSLRQYERFARLVKSDSKKYAKEVQDNSVDLLFIDGDHTYAGVSSDFFTWLPKMTSKGVVIFHDTYADERLSNVAVEAFFEEQRALYPSFSLDFFAGVGILAVGKDIPPDIALLCDSTNSDLPLIKTFFRQLGALTMEVVAPTYHHIFPNVQRDS